MHRPCLYCETPFEISRAWKLFCSDKCRRAHHRENKNFCFFCGHGNNLHRHHLYSVATSAVPNRYFGGVETVMACGACNNSIGDNTGSHIDHQFKLVLRGLEKLRGAKQVQWDDDELKELGPRLRQSIRKATAVYEDLSRRILFAQVKRVQVSDNE